MSSVEARSHTQILPNDENETQLLTPIFRPISRRTPSFSSSSSSLSSPSSHSSFRDPCDYSPVFSPPRTPLRFSGIPFSWEQTPGIPKNEIKNKKELSNILLPHPPAGNSSSSSFGKHCKEECGSLKKLNNKIFQQDPFFAALMECSRDDQEGFGKILKTSRIYKGLVDRLAMHSSCKRVSAVSQSIVFLPRSRDYVSRRPV